MNRAYEVWDTKGNEEEIWVKFRRFAISYKKAFTALIEKKISSIGSYEDEDILPILHLFHHYIELLFKSLLKKAGKSCNTHELKKLLIEIEKNYPDLKLSKLSGSVELLYKLFKSPTRHPVGGNPHQVSVDEIC